MKPNAPIMLVSSSRGVRRLTPPKRRALSPKLSQVYLDERAAPLAGLSLNAARAGSVEAAQIQALLVNHVLARIPVLIVVAGDRDTVDGVCGFFNAVLTLRARMNRHESTEQVIRLGEEGLRNLLGGEAEIPALREVVAPGAVYLVHEDERKRHAVDRVRRCLLPNAFRYAGDLSGAGDPAWISTLSGVPGVVAKDMQLADALFNLAGLREASSAAATARAGAELFEHRTTKALLADWGTELLGIENVHIEQRLAVPLSPRAATVIPDIRLSAAAGDIYVEVETLRGIAGPEGRPLFALESKLWARLRDAAAAGAAQLWVVLPPDCVVLLAGPLGEMVARLQSESPIAFALFTVDYAAREPVAVEYAPREEAVTITSGGWLEATREIAIPERTLASVVGAEAIKKLVDDELIASQGVAERFGIPPTRSLLLYGLPGCGKSYVARAIAGELARPLRVVLASDVTSKWLGAGVGKIRAVFDAAIEQAPCVLLIDELDGVAPSRATSSGMHTDERRQVSELLAQLERIRSFDVIVLATTNYLDGIDSAIRRAGRFDLTVPVLPPNAATRSAIMLNHVPGKARRFVDEAVDWEALGQSALLYTPADLWGVVDSAIRAAAARGGKRPTVDTSDFVRAMTHHPASLRPAEVRKWLEESREALLPADAAWLEEEVRRAERASPRTAGPPRIGFVVRNGSPNAPERGEAARSVGREIPP